MLGNNQRKGAFSDVEQIKGSKARYKKDNELLVLFSCIFATGLVIFLFFGQISIYELFYSPFNYFGDNADGLTGKDLAEKQKFLNDYLKFLIFSCIILYFIIGLLFSKLEIVKTKDKLSVSEKILKILFTPANFILPLFNTSIVIPDDLRAKIGFENGWFEKLDKKFFHQTATKQDGYKRAESLSIFYDMDYILGKRVHNKVKRLFKSDDELVDLLKIIEGYMQGSKLYDELWIGENDIALIPNETTPKHKIYDNFKSYKLRLDINDGVYKDNVVFSRNAFKIFTQKHIKYFCSFLERNTFKLENIKIASDNKFYKSLDKLKNDISFNQKIKKYFGDESAKEFFAKFSNSQTLISDEKARNILFELLATDFSIIAFRSVIERYMGLPAGMLVAKIANYDTRMIIETYKNKNLVKIVPSRNDGSTAQFNSDNYVNLFLIILYDYFNNPGNEFFVELQDKFNTDIDEIPQRESND